MTIVYWLFDAACTDPWSHGYVGVTGNLSQRLKRHRLKRAVFKYRVLFEGSKQECYAFEAELRPEPFIGWNRGQGGGGGPRQPKSAEARERMRAGALLRYADSSEREKMRALMKGRNITWGVKIGIAKQGMKMPWIAESNRRRAGKPMPPRSPEHCAKIAAGWAKKRREVSSCPSV
jgi:hypothetical protein